MFQSDNKKIITAYTHVILLLILLSIECFISIISWSPLSNRVKQRYYHQPHFTEKETEPKERASGMAKVTQLLNVCPGITYIFVVRTLAPCLLGHFGIPGVLSSVSWCMEAPKGFLKEPVSPRQPFCPIGKRSTCLVGWSWAYMIKFRWFA